MARADAVLAQTEQRACEAHVKALAAPVEPVRPVPWGWFVGGVAAGATLVLAVVKVVR